MKYIFAILSFCLVPLAANAADYKCYASKYPAGMQHFFEDGFVTLSVNSQTVKLDYYHENTVTKETTREFTTTYKLAGLMGGNGQLKGLLVGNLKSTDKAGDQIAPIYFEPSIVENDDFEKSGIVGKFVFSGHGYSYDWNICYNLK